MAKTMEHYMSKTRVDYGSKIARPKIEDNDSFELKGKFLKELRDNNFNGSDHEDANEHIKKVLEIVDSFHIPNITIDQVMLKAFLMSLIGATSHWLRNKPSGSITTWEDLKTKFLSKYCPRARTAKKIEEINNFQLDVPTRQILDSRGAIPSKTVANAKVAIQEMAKYSQKFHNGTSRTRRCEQCKVPHYTKDCPLKKEGKTLKEDYNTQFDRTMKYLKGIAENVLVGIGKFVFPIDFIILDMLEDTKVPLILGRPFLSIAHAKIDVFKRIITLRVREEKIIFKIVKPTSSLIKRVYMLSVRERIELDLDTRLMGETLVLNKSLDPFFGDYIELNNLNVPLKLRRDQVDDLIPTIEKGEVVKEFRARNDARIFRYPSDCDHDKKIHIDFAYNLKISCMIGSEFLHANFFPIWYINVMSKKIHNSIMRDKMEYKGNNVVRSLMNIPIFVGTFSILKDFVVLEDMDAYHDEGMGDVIFGEPFLREVRINAKRFEGMITVHNGNEEVTYQKDNSPRINRGTGYDNQRLGNVVGARETVGTTVVQKSGIQCYNCKEFRHVARECQKPKRAKDAAYHREKMLLCKQEEAGIQLNAEQADWRDDIDDKSEDQELEAHYMYMAQIQEVSPDADDSGPIFDSEPLQKNDDDDLANEHELLASLIKKLKCEIDDSKNRNKFLETSNKVVVEKLKETNALMYKDLKKFQAELERRNDVEYASKVEIDCAKATGDLISYKMESQKSFNKYTQQINDLNQTISEMKKELSAHQETISILS
nr:hypothetical protein [Tanacetum cinerariifolium]